MQIVTTVTTKQADSKLDKTEYKEEFAQAPLPWKWTVEYIC